MCTAGMEEEQKQGWRGEKWIDEELGGCQFKEVRFGKRFRRLTGQLAEGLGKSIPLACQDWASTKAAYRFLANDGVSAEQIPAGHFQSTCERLRAGGTLILLLHDTTEFSYRREDVTAVGLVSQGWVRKDKQGQPVYLTTCGICQHASLAVTPEGLPLGLAAVKFWSRKEFKGRERKRKAHTP